MSSLQDEMTTEKERENNGEFNMVPRGSFNHLIESPACHGFPPSSFAPHLVPFSSPTNIFGRADDYLRMISRVFPLFLSFLPCFVLFFEASLSSRALYFSPAISGRASGKTHRVRIGIREKAPNPANVQIPGQQYSNTKGG